MGLAGPVASTLGQCDGQILAPPPKKRLMASSSEGLLMSFGCKVTVCAVDGIPVCAGSNTAVCAASLFAFSDAGEGAFNDAWVGLASTEAFWRATGHHPLIGNAEDENFRLVATAFGTEKIITRENWNQLVNKKVHGAKNHAQKHQCP